MIPPAISDNPILSTWIQFEMDPDIVLVRTGKVELGQGVATALLQIAADALGLPIGRLRLSGGDTASTPDEGWTSASISIEAGGGALRVVCEEVRALFRAEAATRLQVAADAVAQDKMGFFAQASGERLAYWDLSDTVDLDRAFEGSLSSPEPKLEPPCVGTVAGRIDLPRKIGGGGLIHDLSLPGMLHGRIVRPASIHMRLVDLDESAARALPGVAQLVVDGSFIGVCSESEFDAIRAAEKIAELARWSDVPATIDLSDPEFLRDLEAESGVISRTDAGEREAAQTIAGTFSRPFIAHASIGLCCALAAVEEGKLTVWTHSQGVFPLRASLAKALRMQQADIRVIHSDGAGCYGHNGADDVAFDAVLLAKACGRPVRVLWDRAQELAAAPLGAPMLIDIQTKLDAAGEIVGWQQETRSLTHLCRPGWGDEPNLLAGEFVDDAHPPSAIADPGMVPHGGGGARNAIPYYKFAGQEIAYALIKSRPVRTSALRSLGAFGNVFAIESQLDDVAAAAGIDPVELRKKHLTDPRAVAVIEQAVRMSPWGRRDTLDEDQGVGLGFARYKNCGAYCAVIALVRMTETVRVEQVWSAVDAGLVINPDGVLNQVEGGIIQAISWTLKEQVLWCDQGSASTSWESYPILSFDEVPEIDVSILEPPGVLSAGVGECAAGPTAAAIGNALFQGLGVRARRLPLSPENIMAAMED